MEGIPLIMASKAAETVQNREHQYPDYCSVYADN